MLNMISRLETNGSAEHIRVAFWERMGRKRHIKVFMKWGSYHQFTLFILGLSYVKYFQFLNCGTIPSS